MQAQRSGLLEKYVYSREISPVFLCNFAVEKETE